MKRCTPVPSTVFDCDYLVEATILSHEGRNLELVGLENFEATVDQLFNSAKSTEKQGLLDMFGPYGLVLWPSGRALFEKVSALLESHCFAKLKILEIGCGLAAPSLLLAQSGVAVECIDSHPDVATFLKLNCARNEILSDLIRFQQLSWQKIAKSEVQKFDLIIASDVLYERNFSLELAEGLYLLLENSGTVFIADPGRPYLQEFVDACIAKGFQVVTEVHRTSIDHHNRQHDVFMLELRK